MVYLFVIGDEPCADFQCQKSDYCVPKERMCNIAPNCGENDDSDEDPANCKDRDNSIIMLLFVFTRFSKKRGIIEGF